ncbi:hypothetical protein PBI_THONKO_68 [Mycobacterium phage Thonko]|uniref:Uncharacterized protein n=1 Tax=Mycobacterium phage Thonko TaxID=2282910 RepID=A0A346FCB5_9CAUD|nr:hypothetical protein I5G57_gp068 [Mycobacterium phage Thonko]AXN53340.1 hypothetical protein PBI_THONKO_68 [Mycobacterium phage Thonko]
MTEQTLDRTDISHAVNRVSFPMRYETGAQAEAVQRAARKAVAALDRLALECSIAEARRVEADARRTAERQAKLAASLAKQRGKS